jgi:pimeloyl-ACP methyl ester carboxylesterase
VALAVAALLSSCGGGATSPSAATTAATTAVTVAEPAPPAVPHPFGRLSCVPRDGIRFCPGGLTAGHDLRIPSFDGVPLDADVALPATGKGPFPLIVMLHGLGGSKSDWEVSTDDGAVDDVTMASKGFAVLMYTARGFGNSCGTAASRTTAACAAGWIHLADQRYEIRDTQYLAGELVDEGLVRPQIAVTGVSYGAGQTLELATLKNRVRLTDGDFAPWTSPVHHVPMSIGAAYAMWPWDDLVTALVPNGGLLTSHVTPASADLSPVGVEKQSWNTLLYGVTADFFLSPVGKDPSADLTTMYNEVSAGEPFTGPDDAALRELQSYHSAIGIPLPAGGVPPMVIQNGWTDTLFPASEALHYSERVAATDHNPMLLIFDDYGHGWAQAKPADVRRQNAAAIAFLDTVMLGHRRPAGGVLAVGTTCPATAPSSPVLRAGSYSALATGTLQLTAAAAAQTVTSDGGSPTVAAALDPAYQSKLCDPLPAAREPGTAVASLPVTHATTVVGALTVTAHLDVTGDFPELVGRLWDVSASGPTRQLVEAGVVRPDVNVSSTANAATAGATNVTFELAPNEYTVAAGHTLELELVGSTAPWFRASNGTFTISVTDLHARIATH